jgi:hypothetical protein
MRPMPTRYVRTGAGVFLFVVAVTAVLARPRLGWPMQPPPPPPPAGQQPFPPPPPPGPPPPSPPGAFDPHRMQGDAGDALQRAYDAVTRASGLADATQIGAVDDIAPGSIAVNATGTYQEALSRYQTGDFVGARELAAAADDLSRATETLVVDTIATRATQVTPPPLPQVPNEEAFRANNEIARAGQTILQVGSASSYASALPGDAATRVRAVLDLSQRLQQRAQTLLSQNQARQASTAARTADALAHAAEHLQNRYLIAAGIVAAAPPPPPPGPEGRGGPGRGRGRGPQPLGAPPPPPPGPPR